MCEFFSALVLKNGDVLTHPMLDNHTDLVTYFDLPDISPHQEYFAKVQLTPTEDTWLEPLGWIWKLDQATIPRWWSDVATGAESELRRRAMGMIMTVGERRLIVDGCWIVGRTAVVRDVLGGRIIRVQDSAHIRNISRWAYIENVVGSAHLEDIEDWAHIAFVGGSALIQNVGDSAVIRNVAGSAVVRNVRGSARIENVGGSARIENVGDSVLIQNVAGSAVTQNVSDLAIIRNVWGAARLENVGDSVTLDTSARAHLAVR